MTKKQQSSEINTFFNKRFIDDKKTKWFENIQIRDEIYWWQESSKIQKYTFSLKKNLLMTKKQNDSEIYKFVKKFIDDKKAARFKNIHVRREEIYWKSKSSKTQKYTS